MKLYIPVILLPFCIGCFSTAQRPPTRAAIPDTHSSSAAEESRRLPALSEVLEIDVHSAKSPRWYVRIWKDGGGVLVGGSLLGAVFPRSTFDLRKVYDSFAGTLQSVRPDGDCFLVSFSTVTSGGYDIGFYTRDAEAVRSVFDAAKQKCVPTDMERFEKIWGERPPFPK